MVFFNHATRQMTAKIVYYGPGLCGKTTNLNTIYAKTSQKARGEMVSLNTETDRTLFFDLLPMDVGVVGGFKAKLQLYTVPGQVFYNSTRKLVLKGVDGIVFVADSQTPMLDANRESLRNLEANLHELGLELGQIPMVFQWNKRDLKNIVAIEELERTLNPSDLPSFQSVAADGTGVFETLRGITRLALSSITRQHFDHAPVAAAEAPEPAPAQAPSAPALSERDLELPRFFKDEAPVLSPPVPPDVERARALDLSELPSVGELLEEVTPPAELSSPVPRPVPLHLPKPAVPSEPRPPKALPVPRPPVLAPKPSLSLRPPSVLRPSVPLPRPSVGPVLGDLAPLPCPGGGSVLHLDLEGVGEGEDLDIHVEVRSATGVVATGVLHRPSPGKTGTARVTLELKRS